MNDTVAAVRRAMTEGNLLAAYDLASEALAADERDPDLRYLAVSALVRMGSSKRAFARYRALDVEALATVDALALKGRILKDRARQGRPERRSERFAQSADAYQHAFERFGGYFPAINAATTALLAGQTERSAALARAVLEDPEVQAGASYYALATGLEACILLGDESCARRWLARILDHARADADARTSTATQMLLLKPALPGLGALIDDARAALGNPPILAYSGHMFVEGDANEAALALAVARTLADLAPAAAFGALACGADIVIAEAALATGVPLHVVLPFDKSDFIEQSVVNGGKTWLPRFERCFEAARTQIFVSDSRYVGDPAQFNFGTEVAHGLALIRAQPNHAEPVQLAVIQPGATAALAGTARDTDLWARLGYRTIAIDPGPIDRNVASKVMTAPLNRARQSILFADFCGFSKLAEAQLPIFVSEILGAAARVLDAHGGSVISRNSWGDAIYAVIDDPLEAADIALEIQHALRVLPPAISEHSPGAGMRIAIHHGPVFKDFDPILGRETCFGTEVTRAARIEPVTPIGEVYATLAFAAILALRAPDRFALDYVGRIKLAKDYGMLAMFRVGLAAE